MSWFRKTDKELMEEQAKLDAQIKQESIKASRLAHKHQLEAKIARRKQTLAKLKQVSHKDSLLGRAAEGAKKAAPGIKKGLATAMSGVQAVGRSMDKAEMKRKGKKGRTGIQFKDGGFF